MRKKADFILCVDYIQGSCTFGNRCRKPHVDYVGSISDREVLTKVKFCHDFQNRGECVKVGCRFLHVTRNEEDEFLLTGTIPASISERALELELGGGGGGMSARDRAIKHTPLSRGRGGLGQKRPFGGEQGGSAKMPRGGGRGRGRGGRGGGSSICHSSSLPVTYSGICVDYLKGTCYKGDCPMTHLDAVEDQEERQGLIGATFCHDFQNTTCLREFCKFVHASQEEESFFLANGYFPPTLNARNRDKLLFSDTCLDYLCSTCSRGPRCSYKHLNKVESDIERQCLSRSIFCHDFQEGSCLRLTCKMVHMSKKGEDYFLETGMFPRELYAAEDAGNNKVKLRSGVLSAVCVSECFFFVFLLCVCKGEG